MTSIVEDGLGQSQGVGASLRDRAAGLRPQPLRVFAEQHPSRGRGVRENWRDIPVHHLTDEEVALMSRQEAVWCGGLLAERHIARAAPPPSELNIDAAEIAVMDSGDRIRIYPGEGADETCFGGEKLPPLTEREIASNSCVSCLWDRSKVIALEFSRDSDGSPKGGADGDAALLGREIGGGR